ncbi:TPA: hypothetical protein SIA32_003895 [Aeromonas sobria]|nr:hypothetical protein [Aeromonas sobria]
MQSFEILSDEEFDELEALLERYGSENSIASMSGSSRGQSNVYARWLFNCGAIWPSPHHAEHLAPRDLGW